MLAMRLQRTGRSGHSQFRLIVQDSRFSPTRGRVVAYIGSYDPHTKAVVIDGETASRYLQNGAQPSDRVARLLKKEGIKLPGWVQLDEPQKRAVRNPAKRRSTRPEEPKAADAEAPAEPAAEESPAEETPAEPAPEEAPAETEPAEKPEPEPETKAPTQQTPETPESAEEKPAE